MAALDVRQQHVAVSMGIEVTDPIVNRGDLQRMLGKHSDTVRRWMKDGTLPKPDIAPNRQGVAWRASTLRKAGFNLFPELAARPPSGTASGV